MLNTTRTVACELRELCRRVLEGIPEGGGRTEAAEGTRKRPRTGSMTLNGADDCSGDGAKRTAREEGVLAVQDQPDHAPPPPKRIAAAADCWTDAAVHQVMPPKNGAPTPTDARDAQAGSTPASHGPVEGGFAAQNRHARPTLERIAPAADCQTGTTIIVTASKGCAPVHTDVRDAQAGLKLAAHGGADGRGRLSLEQTMELAQWTDAEDVQLRKLHAAHGNDWREIWRLVHGRSFIDCYNRWLYLLQIPVAARSGGGRVGGGGRGAGIPTGEGDGGKFRGVVHPAQKVIVASPGGGGGADVRTVVRPEIGLP